MTPDKQNMPETVLVYPETGDGPIRIWGHPIDHEPHWRDGVSYTLTSTLTAERALCDQLAKALEECEWNWLGDDMPEDVVKRRDDALTAYKANRSEK